MPALFRRKPRSHWTCYDENATRAELGKFKEPGLIGIGIEPHFAIGQRTLFLRSLGGNVLWDCLPLLDQAVVECLKALGGVSAIAISHPHYYSSMIEWSRAFGGVPTFTLPTASGSCGLTTPSSSGKAKRRKWARETLIRCGGHFDGGTVLHWPGGAEGRGALLSGDII